MKYVSLLALISLALLMGCSKTSTPKNEAPGQGQKQATETTTTAPENNPSIVQISSVAQFDSLLSADSTKLIMVDMYADWCKPCHMLAPIFSELATAQQANVLALKVDVDKFPELSQRYEVQGIPFVMFIKQTKVIDQLVGLYPKEDYEARIQAHK